VRRWFCAFSADACSTGSPFDDVCSGTFAWLRVFCIDLCVFFKDPVAALESSCPAVFFRELAPLPIALTAVLATFALRLTTLLIHTSLGSPSLPQFPNGGVTTRRRCLEVRGCKVDTTNGRKSRQSRTGKKQTRLLSLIILQR
jgi:hypothetical protein